jgi:hypothetical protein
MQSTTAPGVPLAHYRQHNGAVTLTCLDCMRYRRFDLEAVIRRLEARGLGGEQTGVKAVAGFVREPCPRCGGARFESRPHFPPMPKGEGWAYEGPRGR